MLSNGEGVEDRRKSNFEEHGHSRHTLEKLHTNYIRILEKLISISIQLVKKLPISKTRKLITVYMVTLKSEIWVFHRLPGYFKNKLGLSVRV